MLYPLYLVMFYREKSERRATRNRALAAKKTDIYTDIIRHFIKSVLSPCGIPQGYSSAIFSAIVFIATNW